MYTYLISSSICYVSYVSYVYILNLKLPVSHKILRQCSLIPVLHGSIPRTKAKAQATISVLHVLYVLP